MRFHLSIDLCKNKTVTIIVRASVKGLIIQTPVIPKNAGKIKVRIKRIIKPRRLEIRADSFAFPRAVKYIEAITFIPIRINSGANIKRPLEIIKIIFLSCTNIAPN